MVIELPDENWCAFEIKLGDNLVDAAASNLINRLTIEQKIQKDFHRKYYVKSAE